MPCEYSPLAMHKHVILATFLPIKRLIAEPELASCTPITILRKRPDVVANGVIIVAPGWVTFLRWKE